MTMSRRPPSLYFSLRSPYSWLALDRLRRALGDLSAFDCVPYWDPDDRTLAGLTAAGGEFHYVQMSRAKHLYMLLDTKRTVQADGRDMAWPIDVDPWWERPHLGWLHARASGRGWEFYDALMAARWGRGEDICDETVLAGAARGAGLDPEAVLAAVDDPHVRVEGVDCLYRAYLDDVFGIPYVKWGRHRFWGLDRVDAFLSVWRPAPTASGPVELPAEVLAAARPYDLDTAGGCG